MRVKVYWINRDEDSSEKDKRERGDKRGVYEQVNDKPASAYVYASGDTKTVYMSQRDIKAKNQRVFIKSVTKE